MSQTPELNKTNHLFTAPNEQAAAIAAIAAGYPDEEIKADVRPIRNPEDARGALGRIARVRIKNVCISEVDWKKVEERYEGLGKSGMSSMVELEVPVGSQNFDFKAFYEKVDSLLERPE